MTVPRGWRSRLAIVLYVLAVASMVVGIVSWFVPATSGPRETLMELLSINLAILAYATVGTLILVRQPENRVGWLVGAVGLFPIVGGLTDVYVERAADWPLSDAAPWFNSWNIFAGVFTLPLLFLLFPDGRPASKPWRWPVLIAATGLAAMLVRYMAGPRDCGEMDCGGEVNPFQPGFLRPYLDALDSVGWIGFSRRPAGRRGLARLALPPGPRRGASAGQVVRRVGWFRTVAACRDDRGVPRLAARRLAPECAVRGHAGPTDARRGRRDPAVPAI